MSEVRTGVFFCDATFDSRGQYKFVVYTYNINRCISLKIRRDYYGFILDGIGIGMETRPVGYGTDGDIPGK